MCGIAGFLGQFSGDVLARMNQRQAHRGPDSSAEIHIPESQLGLAHRRLSIIDLSAAGNQPMWDKSGRFCIVFNGEIYNYRELRSDLASGGYEFRSHTDTEILLALYSRHQHDMLPFLNGIFAFALWDTERQELFVVRDPLGIKPLYYATNELGFIFASEIKSILAEPSISRKLDPTALAQYLTFLWSPAPRTPLAGVKKLEPGNALVIRQGKVQQAWQYAELPQAASVRRCTGCDLDDMCSAVRTEVGQAVERQMVADVPVGAFLSGGLDSSTVVAFAQKHHPQKLQCFTIAPGDKGGAEDFSEDHRFARVVAKHLNVDLHEVPVQANVADLVDKMVYHLDEPQPDPAALNVLLIAQLARQHGIPVLLSGAGGDDIFTGYRRHAAVNMDRVLDWVPTAARTSFASAISCLPSQSRWARRVKRVAAGFQGSSTDRLLSHFSWLLPERAVSLLSPELRQGIDAEDVLRPLKYSLSKVPPERSNLDRMLFLEGKHFLADHNLNYTDKMSMAVGVETRVPLLDWNLVQFADTIPDRWKQRGLSGKWILKKAMEPLLPAEVIYRKKAGFGLPIREWIKTGTGPFAPERASAEALCEHGVFDRQAVDSLLTDNALGRIDATYTIFGLVCINSWCRQFL